MDATRQQANGSSAVHASREELLSFYHDMLLIRRFEERAGQLYGMGLIGGFCHLYIGQEAVVVGMQAAMQDRKSTRLNSSHIQKSRMPSSA